MSRPKASGCWNEQHARPQKFEKKVSSHIFTPLSSRFWNRTTPLVLRCWDALCIVVLLTLSLGRTWQPRYLTCGRTPWSAKERGLKRTLRCVNLCFFACWKNFIEFPNSVSLSFDIHQLAYATYALKTHASGCPEIFLSRAMLSRTWNRYDNWKSHWHTWFSEVTLSCWPKRDFSNARDCGRFVQWSQKQPGTGSIGRKPCWTMFNRILLRGKEHQQCIAQTQLKWRATRSNHAHAPVFTSLGDGTSGMTSAASENDKTWQADPCFFAVFQPSSINSLYLSQTVPSINLLLCLNLKCRIHLFNLSPPLSLIKSTGAFFARLCPNGTGALLINSLDTSRSRKRSRRTNQRCPAEISKAFRTRLLSSCSLHPTQSRQGPLICYHRYLRHQRLLCLSAAIVKMHLHMKLCIHFLSDTRCKFNTGIGSFCPIWRVDGVFVQDNPALQISQWGIIPWTFVPIMRVQCLCITCQRSTHTFSQKIVVACFNHLQSVDSRLYLPIESKSQGTNTE